MIRTVNVSEITAAVKEMCIKANHFLSEDMADRMKLAVEQEESSLGKQILNQLQLDGYITATNDEYAVLRLTTKAGSVLNNEETVWMKLAKEQTKSEQETQKKSRKKKSALAGSGEFTEAEENLFETLRKLRAQIAKEEKVPPYIVFSDKTLAHMCIIKPVNKEEMLSVSGVGEFKYEKYGERFLAAVREQTE